MKMQLSSAFIVHTAPSAEDALRHLEQVRPDLVLSDVSMPGIGGLGLYQALPPKLRHRTVFMTAGIADPTTARGIHSCGQPLLRKPVRFPLLRETLHRLLSEPPPAEASAVALTA